MPSKSTGATKRARIAACRALARDTQQSDAEAPILSLPPELINLILSHQNLRDGIDLARLRPVSREMRDAVTATGREISEMIEGDAVKLGYLNTLKHLHS